MSPRTFRALAAAAALAALAALAAGVVLAARTAAAIRETQRIQHGPRALAVVVRTGAVSGRYEHVTLRYSDRRGRRHEFPARFPLGIGDGVDPGEATTVAYDPSASGRAELAAHPRHRWQDVLLDLALAVAAAGAALRWAALLLTQARRSEDAPDVRLGAHGSVVRTAARTRPATGRHVAGTLGVVAAVLLVAGRLTVQIAAADRPQEVAFPPPPLLPHLAPRPLPAALTAAPESRGPLVTPAEGDAIATAAFGYRDAALARHDLASLSAIDGDPALAVDASRTRLGLAPPRPLPSARDVRAFATFRPRQTHWPLRLLSKVLTSDRGVPALELLVLTRASASAHWRIALDTVVTGNDRYTPALNAGIPDRDGYDLVPDPSWISAGAAVPALARYWQAIRDTGRPPPGGPPFADGYWTTGYYDATIAGKQDRRGHNGLRAHVDFDARPAPADEVWSFGIDPGWTLVCSPLRATETWTGPAHQDANRQKWGVELAPGVYRSVTGTIVRETCVFVADDGPRPLGVIGGDPWTIGVRGVR